MDSPIRTTKPEDKRNIRKEFRGGLLREVWDEPGKTAVWDLTDRWGNPIGEQSWDEYEAYLDEQIRRKQELDKEQEYKRSPEYLDKRKEKARKRRYDRAFGRRDKLLDIVHRYLLDHPFEQPQIPAYRFRNLLLPYMGKEKMATTQMILTMKAHQESFEEIGLIFGEGWSAVSRNICTYIGYDSEDKIEDQRKKTSKYEAIAAILITLPAGEYTPKELTDFVYDKYDRILKHNLQGLLVRNAYRWDLIYYNDIFIKE